MLWGLGARSGAAPRPSSREGASASRAAVYLLAAARRAVPGAAGPARRGEASATAAFPAGQCLVLAGSGPGPRCPRRPGADMARRPAETWERPFSSSPSPLPVAAQERPWGDRPPEGTVPLGGPRPRPGAGRNWRATRLLCYSADVPLAWGWQQPPAVNTAAGGRGAPWAGLNATGAAAGAGVCLAHQKAKAVIQLAGICESLRLLAMVGLRGRPRVGAIAVA